MPVTKLLIANRGEIAIRIARAAADMGLPTVAVHSEDDAASLHLRTADEVVPLKGQGAAAYLDMDKVIAAAKAPAATPSIRLRLPRRARRFRQGLHRHRPHLRRPAGQTPRAVRRQGPRAAGGGCGLVPVIRGIDRACTLEDVKSFFASLGSAAR